MNSTAQNLIIIALCALATQLTRFLPFLLFPAGKKTPAFIQFLGHALPAAVFSMLVVYCLKGVNITSGAFRNTQFQIWLSGTSNGRRGTVPLRRGSGCR